MRYLLIIAALVLSTLSGCVSMTPALAGKTHYEMRFVDTLTPVEGEAGQNTEFTVKVDAPAGVDITNLASMDYDWNPDNSGSIAVAGDTAADTTAQAAALVEVGAQQAQAFTGLIQALATVLPALTAQKPPGGVVAPSTNPPFELPFALPTDLAGWIQFAQQHPELLSVLQGLGK
jgi:hypothetical protein